ncbi:MAG: hypothetical protein ACT4OE_04700, partial [Sphingosinicella sp.]
MIEGDLLLNLVTDPDLSPRTLGVISRIVEDFRGRVINRPERVLASGRDRAAQRLAGVDGLVVPLVLRLDGSRPETARAAIAAASPRFPMILRETGTHTGRIVGVVGDAGELLAGLAPGKVYYATEFVDFRSPDGRYRKYRFFFIGGDMIFRHMVAGESWDVHMRDRLGFMIEQPGLLAEEKALFDGGMAAFPAPARRGGARVGGRQGREFRGGGGSIISDRPGGRVGRPPTRELV